MKALNDRLLKYIDYLIDRYPVLEECKECIIEAYLLLEECYMKGRKLLIAGNGGSAADAEHMAGELMKKFKIPRPISKELRERLIETDPIRGKSLAKNLECPLRAIPLVSHEALMTAYMNDVDGVSVFAQEVFGFGEEGDVFLGISTSGDSENIIYAAVIAKTVGIKVLGLTGIEGGELAKIADVCIKVPQSETYIIQEYHLPIYHCLCLMLEDKFFNSS